MDLETLKTALVVALIPTVIIVCTQVLDMCMHCGRCAAGLCCSGIGGYIRPNKETGCPPLGLRMRVDLLRGCIVTWGILF